MRRYLLGFLWTYLFSLAVTAGLVFFAFFHWFMQASPLWFDVLTLVLLLLPFLAGGQLTGRKPGNPPLRSPAKVLTLLLVLTVGVSALDCFSSLDFSGMLGLTALPCLGTGNVVVILFPILAPAEKLINCLGGAIPALLFHLGWHWGQENDRL